MDDWDWSKIANNFDQHVEDQLPWYNLVCETIAFFVQSHLPNKGTIIDVGSATGTLRKNVQTILDARNAKLIEIDSEKNMNNNKDFICIKAEDYEPPTHDISVWNLTLMFINPAIRSKTLKKFYDKTNPGGIIIGVDRIAKPTQHALTYQRLILSQKKANPEQIIKKEIMLSGIQRPLTQIPGETWFQYTDFYGWIITKPENLNKT